MMSRIKWKERCQEAEQKIRLLEYSASILRRDLQSAKDRSAYLQSVVERIANYGMAQFLSPAHLAQACIYDAMEAINKINDGEA